MGLTQLFSQFYIFYTSTRPNNLSGKNFNWWEYVGWIALIVLAIIAALMLCAK